MGLPHSDGSRLPKGEFHMKRVVFLFALFSIFMAASSVQASASNTYSINFEESARGIVNVFFNTGTEKKVKLMVQKGTDQYVYNLSNSNQKVNFPLQFGDGTYTVSIYENTTGTKYRKLYSLSHTVKLESQNVVFLQSIQEVSWNEKDAAISKAKELVASATTAKRRTSRNSRAILTETEVVNVLYQYVVKNVAYDYNKIKTLQFDYLPNINDTLAVGTGICYDYSSLLASMLRSQGIPTKLVKGYTNTTDVYHAWNEIYLKAENRWVVVDTTFDAYLFRNNRTYVMEKKATDYQKSKEY